MVMRVTKDGDFFRGCHSPGPTHNFLKMRVLTSHQGGFEVRVLPPIGGCTHGDPIIAEEAHEWIALGVERANREIGIGYGVVEAEVVANDSRRPEVYVELARRIVLAAHHEAKD